MGVRGKKRGVGGVPGGKTIEFCLLLLFFLVGIFFCYWLISDLLFHLEGEKRESVKHLN